MGINLKKRIALNLTKHCPKCNLDFPSNFEFCTNCGTKLKNSSGNVYANIGKNGISSISVKQGNITVNSKGKVTVPIAPGISYTSDGGKNKKQKKTN